MNRRTRYFVIASLLVLGIGVGAGLIAYYVGVPTAFAQQGPDELQLIPSDAVLVAYANVHEVMVSNLRERVRRSLPQLPDGQREFENATGINIESDVDRVVAAVVPPVDGPHSGLLIAAGRFDQVRIEGLMREHGAADETYKGRRLLAAPHSARPDRGAMSLAFLEPGLVAVGSASQVRAAIDRREGGDSVRNNGEIMGLVRSLGRGNVWAVGRFDALTSQTRLPANVASQLPPITWFAVSGHVNGGLLGDVQMETRDEESANQFRDIVRGIIALGQMQANSRPELQGLMRSIQVSGTGTKVAVSFELPAEMIDLLSRPGELQPGR